MKRLWDILEYTGIFFIGHTFFITLSINFLNWLILLMDEICISIRMHFYALYLCIFIICPVWCHYSRRSMTLVHWLCFILHLYLIILDFYPSKLLEFWFMYWNSVKLNTWKWKNILENVLEYTLKEETFAVSRFLAKFAKVYSREIFQKTSSAKVSSREIF